jgi:hypothetical protein
VKSSLNPCGPETASTRCHYERIERYRPFAARIDDNRIEIDLTDRRFVEQQEANGAHNPDNRCDVEPRRTAKAF